MAKHCGRLVNAAECTPMIEEGPAIRASSVDCSILAEPEMRTTFTRSVALAIAAFACTSPGAQPKSCYANVQKSVEG